MITAFNAWHMTKNHSLKALLVLFASLVVHFSKAQNSIFTDRPNVTDAVVLLPQGTFQIELGYFRETSDDGDIVNRTSPNVNIKYGLAEWLELRVLTNYLDIKNETLTDEVDVSGLTPFSISPKIKLYESQNWLSNAAVTTTFTLPSTGANEFQNDHLNFGYRLLLENNLGDFTWSHGLGTDWDDETDALWSYSSALGTSFLQDWSGFVEIYGSFSNGNSPTHGANAGILYLLTTDIQLDTSFGIGLNDNAADFFASFGFAWRTSFTE